MFAFSCRIVFRLMFFTFGNLTILVFLLNDQRIDKWRGILLGDNVAIIGNISHKSEFKKLNTHIRFILLYGPYIIIKIWCCDMYEKLESCCFA